MMKRRLMGLVVLAVLACAVGCSSSTQHSTDPYSASYSQAPTYAAVGTPASEGASYGTGAAETDTAASADAWQFQLMPYLWMSSISGDLQVGPLTPSVDVSFGDLLGALEFGLAARFEGHKNRWGFFVDGTYMALAADVQLRRVEIDDELQQAIVEFGASYMLWESSGRTGNKPALSLEILGGGRWWYLKNELDMSPGPDVAKSGWWIDPIIGPRVTWRITEKIAANVRADYGGFGIGSASDSTFSIFGAVNVELWKNKSLVLGYRYLDIEHGIADLTFKGPWVGFAFDF